MNKLFTTLFSAIIEEMYKLFKLGKDTDSLVKTMIKKSIMGLTLIMIILTFVSMGQRLITLSQEYKELKTKYEALILQSKNQSNASSDSTLDDAGTYSLSSHGTHCADNFCRHERRMSTADGFHGIKIRTHND